MAKEKTKKVNPKRTKTEKKKTVKVSDQKITNAITQELKKQISVTQKINKKAIAKKLGRPTKYEPHFATDMVEFFSRDYWIEEEIEKINPMTAMVYKVKVKRPNDFPTFEKFCADICIDPDTISNWANAKDDDGNLLHPDFFGAYKVCKAKQKDFLIYHGLAGNYNGSFAIFTAKNITDMRDKSEVEHGGSLSLGIASISKVIQEQSAKVKEIKDDEYADFEAITPANTGEYSQRDN